MRTTQLDIRDSEILETRTAALPADSPNVGDYVEFADGVTRRISYLWDGTWSDGELRYQTSDSGSFYLGKGYVSFSGSLYGAIKGSTLALTDERRGGSVWFFHHDRPWAHNGVEAVVSFKVYTCSQDATS